MPQTKPQQDTDHTETNTGEQGDQQQPDREVPFEELPKFWQQEIKRQRKEKERLRQRAKKAADDEWYARAEEAVSKLDEAEEARKSEAQKLTEKLNAEQQRADSAELDRARYRAAVKAGFTGDDAEDIAGRLRGESDEDLTADAQSFAQRFSPQQQRGVRPDPTQGGGGGGQQYTPLNDDKLANALTRAVNGKPVG